MLTILCSPKFVLLLQQIWVSMPKTNLAVCCRWHSLLLCNSFLVGSKSFLFVGLGSSSRILSLSDASAHDDHISTSLQHSCSGRHILLGQKGEVQELGNGRKH